jgi:hypothetical protein
MSILNLHRTSVVGNDDGRRQDENDRGERASDRRFVTVRHRWSHDWSDET